MNQVKKLKCLKDALEAQSKAMRLTTARYLKLFFQDEFQVPKKKVQNDWKMKTEVYNS